MKKVWTFIVDCLKHPIINTAISAALCRLFQSQYYKRVLQMEIEGIWAELPWIIFGLYAVLSLADLFAKNKDKDKIVAWLIKYLKPLYFHIVIVLTTALSIVIPYFK